MTAPTSPSPVKGNGSPWDVKEMGENLEEGYIRSVKDINRYGREAFAKDALLMNGNINVEILSVTDLQSGNALEVECSYEWILNGHVKPVPNIKQTIVFSVKDEQEIVIL